MKKLLSNRLNPFIGLSLILYYPFVVFTILGGLLIPYKAGYFKEILGFGFFSLLFYCIFLILNSYKLRKWWLLISYTVLSTIAFIKISFYYFYKVKISSSAVFVVLETNFNEATEYLNTYINGFIIATFFILFLPILFFLKNYINKQPSLVETILSLKVKSIKSKLVLVFVFIISIYVIQWKFKQENFMFAVYKSYNEYKETKELLKSNLANQESDILTNVKNLNKPQTYIIIIGESTSKWHLQLYGYGRETNPLLTEINKELIVFKDVITPNVHTITALEKILTLSDVNNPNKKENGSILQLANQAGFKTYWISNQKPVGYYESIPTLIGSAAANKYFITTDNYNYNIYDESLLPYLEKILNEKQSKKIIFIHLIGTHISYHKRYPEKYNIYKNEYNGLKYKHKKAIQFVNKYDNAVLYNDYIVREIINKVKIKDINSYVLYFSDHGDEVFDTMDYIGHNEYYGTKPMFEVPFILWLSDKYKKNNPISKNYYSLTDRRYSLENFIHSFSEISNIKFDSLDPSKSIFNSNFMYRPRIIKKKKDYDSD